MKGNTKNEIKVSVIVCCYRGEKTIKDCLHSLCNQTFEKSDYEIILVDDGSIDDTSVIIKTFLSETKDQLPLIRYFKKENEGLSVARNYGIERAHGEIISFIDEDAFADMNFVEAVFNEFNSDISINCMGGKVNIWNKDAYFAKLFHYSLFNYQMNALNLIIGANMSFKRQFLNEIDGFQKEFNKRGDETALFIKAGNKLRRKISTKIVVAHTQPDNVKHFIRTRYENGYYKALAASLKIKYNGNKFEYISKSTGHFLFLLLPFFTIVILPFSALISSLIGLIYILLLLKRYVINKELIGPLTYIYKSKIFFKVNDYLLISNVIIRGFIKEDWGYVKGVIKFYNYNWK